MEDSDSNRVRRRPVRIRLIAVFFALWMPATHAADWVVQPGQSIQAAIQLAQAGDRVLVKPGTYHETIDFLGKAIEVIGEGGPRTTILDGTGLNSTVVKFVNFETDRSVLRGFQITGGSGSPIGGVGPRFGGAILADGSAPTIEQCELFANTADYGGGAYSQLDVRPTIRDCLLESNTAVHDGGGLFGSWSIERCVFLKNAATNGGGLGGTTLCLDSSFISNFATRGGGACNKSNLGIGSDNQFERCVFRNNFAEEGGGAYQVTGYPALFHRFVFCRFEQNTATTGFGGGAWLQVWTNSELFPAENPVPEVESCVFAHNSAMAGGDGLLFTFNADLAEIANNTFYGDSLHLLAGTARDDGLRISNCIFAKSPFDDASIAGSGGYLEVRNCILTTPGYGPSNQVVVPIFVDAANGDFRLAHGSPGIDNGTQVGLSLLPVDLAGIPRVLGNEIDRGAHEFALDCDVDGVADYLEIATNPALDCDHDLVLDDCPTLIDCNGNGRADACDIANGLALDCNRNGIPDSCDAQTGGDLNGDGAIDDCSALLVPQVFPTIQAALNAAIDGSIVLLDDGTYRGVDNVNLDPKGKAITLRSRHGSAHCVIDGENLQRLLFAHQTSASPIAVEGITLRRGRAAIGGAISVSNGARVDFTRCVIEDSVATTSAGAVSVLASATAKFSSCVFRNCQAKAFGGAAAASSSSSITLQRCTFVGNRVLDNPPVNGQGSTLHVSSAAAIQANECIFADEIPPGGSVGFATNPGSRLGVERSLTTLGAGSFKAISGGTIDYAANNLTANPRFIGAFDGDVHLRADSPARDRGTSFVVDYEGDAALGTPDLGADEFQSHLYAAPAQKPNSLAIVGVAPPGTSLFAFADTALAPYPLPSPYGPFYLAVPPSSGSPFGLGFVRGEGFIQRDERIPPGVTGLTLFVQGLALTNPPRLTNFASFEID